MTAQDWFLVGLMVFFALGSLINIVLVGKPREPLGGCAVAFIVVMDVLVILGLAWVITS